MSEATVDEAWRRGVARCALAAVLFGATTPLASRLADETSAPTLVALVVIVYVGYLAFDGMPFVRDTRGIAAAGLVLGFASRRIGGRSGVEHGGVVFAAGLASIALGIVALATQSELVLADFVASIVALWVAATCVRTGHSIGGIRLSH